MVHIDPNGKWDESVHLKKTKEWASKFFNDRQSRIIANANNDVDAIGAGRSYLPWVGDQGYHFNINGLGENDSRLDRAEQHLSKAINLQKQANALKLKLSKLDGDQKAYMELRIGIMEDDALIEIGRGLHALQDTKAHTLQVTHKKIGIYYHDQIEVIDNGDDDANTKAVAETERISKEYINRFLDNTK